jgi:hypothetical protein
MSSEAAVSAEVLDLPHLSLIDDCSDDQLRDIRQAISRAIDVDGRAGLEATLCDLLAHGRSGAPKTLDLIGHSTADGSLLVLGDWVIDATSPVVTAFFRELAEQNVLGRLGVTAVRLLGCSTAVSAQGIWTVCTLAEILGVEVFGTTAPLLASHYDRDGFSEARRYLLVSASQLRAQGNVARPNTARRSGYVLDVDALPPVALDRNRSWSVHVVNAEQARELLCLIRRNEGTAMPGLVASPACELALPSAVANAYHRIEVFLDGEIVRVHPTGTEPIVYPVADPATFRTLISYASRR